MSVNLLIDSSDQNLSVGIAEGNHLISFVSYPAWQRQSELLVFEMDRILKLHGISRNDIAGVVVARTDLDAGKVLGQCQEQKVLCRRLFS